MTLYSILEKEKSKEEEQEEKYQRAASSSHQKLLNEAYDYSHRFVGSCNTTTDIKEANFFGADGQFIVAGSDCGCMLLWDRRTTNLLEAWQGDEAIVNCVQPHPATCMIASSGLDPVVRLWSPRPVDESQEDSRGKEVEVLARCNQKRMNTDPFEEMLRSMGYRTRDMNDENNEDDENATNSDDDPQQMQCRTS